MNDSEESIDIVHLQCKRCNGRYNMLWDGVVMEFMRQQPYYIHHCPMGHSTRSNDVFPKGVIRRKSKSANPQAVENHPPGSQGQINR